MNRKVQFFTILCMVTTIMQSSPDRPLTLSESIFVGGVAGAAEVALPGQILAYATNVTIRRAPFVPFDCYNGFTAHVTGQMPIIAMQKVVKNQVTQAVQARQEHSLSDVQNAGVSFAAGAAVSLIDTPSNAIQLCLQRSADTIKTNAAACRELGVKGLTRGALVNAALKEGPFAMAYQFATPKFAKFLQEQGVKNKLEATAIAGSLVGVATAVMTQPGAVVRGTMQNDPHGAAYKNARKPAQTIYQRDGLKGFLRGLPQRGCRVAMAVPLLVIYETALEKSVKDR